MKQLITAMRAVSTFLAQHIFYVLILQGVVELFYNQDGNVLRYSSVKAWIVSILYTIPYFYPIVLINIIALVLFIFFIKKIDFYLINKLVYPVGIAFLIGVVLWFGLVAYFGGFRASNLDSNGFFTHSYRLLIPKDIFMQCFVISNLLFFLFYYLLHKER